MCTSGFLVLLVLFGRYREVVAFTIRETIHDEPGWRADGTYGLANLRVWQIFEDGLWIADCASSGAAELAVLDLEFAVEESAVLDLTDDSVS